MKLVKWFVLIFFIPICHLYPLSSQIILRRDPPCGNAFSSCKNQAEHMNYIKLSKWLEDFADKHKDLVRLFSLGQSNEGKEIWAVEISDKPDDQTEFEPNFKYVANMHGDEVTGQVMLLRLMELLVNSYRSDARIKNLVDNTHIFFVPLMNPDGWERCKRENARGIDLNRNFPDRITNPVDVIEGKEPETAAIMLFLKMYRFTLSANMHGGEVVANYPWDNIKDNRKNTDDDDIFKYISIEYAIHNPPMYSNKDFPQGITNGATWYALHGGMQDYNYMWGSCLEVTLEISCEKLPPVTDMDGYWQDNRESLIRYIEMTHMGVRGRITDKITKEPIIASVQIVGRDLKVHSDSITGKYFRMLLPGNYTITVEASGYKSHKKNIIVSEEPLVVDFLMGNETDPETEQQQTPIEQPLRPVLPSVGPAVNTTGRYWRNDFSADYSAQVWVILLVVVVLATLLGCRMFKVRPYFAHRQNRNRTLDLSIVKISQ